MNKRNILLSITIVCTTIAYAFANLGPGGANLENPYSTEFIQASVQDTVPLSERYDSYLYDQNQNPFDLKDPPIIEKEIEYDPESGQYIVHERIGDEYYRMPYYLTFDEYMDYRQEEQERDYFKKLAGMVDANASASGGINGLVDPIKKLNLDENLLDRLFGGTGIKIEPTGEIGLIFGYGYNKTENPAQLERNQSYGYPIFDMAPLEMNVQGKIGDKLNLDMSYNTAATFNFDNQMKINYSSDEFSEDEIIKKIEAGNVSLPLRSNLIQGSEALFGLKTELQFGRFWLTALASQKRSRQEAISLQNGAQEQFFEVKADEYDQFRHFFVSHFNRNTFETALDNIPQINTLFNITNVQVWVTNDNSNVNDASREIVAFADLGEYERITNNNSSFQPYPSGQDRDICGENVLPDNDSNPMYGILKADDNAKSLDRSVAALQGYGLQQGRDFEKVRARQLRQGSEFTYNRQLGFISININLRPDQVLAVAYEYDYNGKYYAVGDLANNVSTSSRDFQTTQDPNNPTNPTNPAQDTTAQQQMMFLKLLKGTTPRIDLPNWDLMMKNVYSIGAYNVDPKDFRLDIFYDNPGEAETRFLPTTNLAGTPLLRVFNLDKLNIQRDPCADGIFDFVEGVTINTQNGRVIFPVLEPFGKALQEQIDDVDSDGNGVNDRIQFSYQMLYDSTLTRAREYPEFNRYTIKGEYKSSISSEISLGAFNLPPGSVRVTAGRTLIEGQDYEVDYNIGRVRILNEAILNAGTPINVSFENNSLFGFQQKTMVGLRGEYRFNEDVSLGGTYMHLFERPFTQKVNIGDDPINNRVYGLDFSLTKDAPWLTKAIDALPLIETKAPSSINFLAEAAYLRPGHAKAINESKEDKAGILMLDDFEGSASSVDLRQPANRWFLASVPQDDLEANNPLFPESALINSTLSNVNRARMSWYRMEPNFQVLNTDATAEQAYFTSIPQQEVFPNLQVQPLAQNNTIFSLDMTYYPDERGPYNFDQPNNGTAYSAGINEDGSLKDPDSRWGGIMREITSNNDFEQSNIEFIEFWVMSPFLPKQGDANISGPGDLYINIGNISEDILRDSRQAYENGLPGVKTNTNRPTRTTELGRIPELTPLINGFNQELEDREAQDVGLDGVNNAIENSLFENEISAYQGYLTPNELSEVQNDPSNDDFVHFNDPIYENVNNPIERYRDFNGTEGNSPAQTGNLRSAATNLPDSEDLNNDKSLNETESYFQYKIPFVPDGEGGIESNQYLTDVREPEGANGRKWYRFKIPLDQWTSRVGGIQDFRSIRFLRMYLKGFDEQVTFRFARLELVRNQWRRYRRSLATNTIAPIDEGSSTLFDVNAINIEENGGRCPFNYVLPPGIQREQSLGAFPNVLQNEQALSMDICNLQDGDSRAIYNLYELDMRVYERLKMFVHAENANANPADSVKLSAFVRIGSDFEQNYYEYEIPLSYSDSSLVSGCFNENGNANETSYIDEVWKARNAFDFPLTALKNVKIERNREGASIQQLYPMADPDNPNNTISVLGNPTLGEVKGVMVGVRNLRDDGVPACAEVWINELRVSGFNERSGAAGLARLDMQLADFGAAGLSYQATSIGWGGIEDRVQERSRKSVTQYEAATNLELGKLLPEQSGIKIPFLFSHSNITETPEFDPNDSDLLLQERIDIETDNNVKDSIRTSAKDVTTITSYNFTNVRKERTGKGKPMPWDISNFSFTYARSKTEHSDPLIEKEQIDSYQGAVDYAYSMKPLYIQPFKKLIKGKKLKVIGDLNFNLIPNKFAFNTIMDRNRTNTRWRSEIANQEEYEKEFFNKRFTWDRNYNLDWDLTKSLKLRFDARNQAVIDELKDAIFDDSDQYIRQRTRDELHEHVIGNIKDFGRNKLYTHTINASYTVPFKKIPFLDWMTVKANYGADYSWAASSLNADSLGNVISNNRDIKINGDLNFESLYKKSKYLSKIGGNKSKGRRGSSRMNRSLDKDKPNDGKDSKDKKAKKTKKVREPSKGEKILIRPLLMIRKGKLSYQETEGTTIPGFTPQTEFFGLSEGFQEPGWQFVSGWQPNIRTDRDDLTNRGNYLYQLEDRGTLTNSAFLSEKVSQNFRQNINSSLTLEPFNDFRIELTATRQYGEDYVETFKITEKGGEDYQRLRPLINNGSLVFSYNSLSTLFSDSLTLDNNFRAAQMDAAWALAAENNVTEADSTGFPVGYGQTHQGVYLPAFIAAYGGKDLGTVQQMINNGSGIRNMFQNNTYPRINWNVNYSGLSKIPAFQEVFKKFDLSHSYKSDFTVNSYQTHQKYNSDNPFEVNEDNENNYFPSIDIPDVGISESFSPLIGIGFELQNSLSFDVLYNKSRTLALRTSDYTLTESRSDEFTVGFGYIKEDVYIGFLKNLGNPGGKKKKKKKKLSDIDVPGIDIGGRNNDSEEEFTSDLSFRFDISYRNDFSYINRLDRNVSEITRGSRDIRFSGLITYGINEQLDIQLYFDYSNLKPLVTTSYPSTTARGGLKILFTL